MTADPKAVQELFAQAISITDPAQRDQFLVEKSDGNMELYTRVVQLLAAYHGGMGLLESPTNAFAATIMHSQNGQQPGHVIAGRYKLLEAIGEGGMGSVWVAEQTQPVRRKVALKLVKPGMDSKQVLARFDAERQALALMDHPNIAKVFDGGVTDQGRPFFAMEYVKGMPLTEYCDQMRLPVEERLKLFVPICQAVQHAHQKGIIHRDLKPSNVLICLYDGKPVPKVIDFGLAKAMHQPLTEQTVYTGHGLMIGTPLYMSPEQAEHNNLDVDTRTDIYSLGVMLYELLTGSTPLERAHFKDAALVEILRLIKEVEPPKPSTRVSSSASLPTIAAQRNLDSKQLGRSIRGDLDWIVMKAIEKDRVRRYDTANGLARDIERFLNLEAVEACPPSASYRLRRLARRHRAMLGTATAFAMILVLGAGLSVWQALRATKAEALASRRLIDVQAEQQKTQAALESSQQSAVRAMQSESQATAKTNELQTLTEEQRRIIYVSEMNQARIEAQRGNLARLREILMEHLPIDGKEDLRGFEWNYWYRYLNQAKVFNKFEKATIDERNSALVTIIPGGSQVAWSEGKSTTLIDLKNGTSRRLPFSLRHYVDATKFSENGRAIVGACFSHTFPSGSYKPPGTDQGSKTSCDVVEPNGEVKTLEYPTDAFQHVSALNINRDGSRAVVIGYDASHSQENAATRICVWDVDSKQMVLNEVYRREINRISFSPDGKMLAAHLCHGTQRNSDAIREVAVIIDLANGREISAVEYDDDIDSLFWTPSSDRILLCSLGFSGANRKQLLSWRIDDTSKRPLLLSKEPMPDYVNGAVSPDASMIAITGHLVQNIRLFDTSRGELIDTLQTDGKGIVSLAFSGDGKQLMATTVGGELIGWDLGKDRDLFGLRTNPLPRIAKNGYGLSKDQALLAIALADGGILVRTRDGAETMLGKGKPSAATGSHILKFSPDNKLLAKLSNVGPDGITLPRGKGFLEVFDLVEKKRLWQTNCRTVAILENFVTGLVIDFSSDGQKLVHLADASYVYDARTGRGTALDLREKGNASTPPLKMQRNAKTGALFASVNELKSDGVLSSLVFDPLSGNEIYAPPKGPSFALTSLAPDGEHGSVFHPAGVEIWNLQRDEKVVSVPGVFAIFSPDSKRFAILLPEFSGRGQVFSGITIWDLANRKQLCELHLAAKTIEEVRFSPDGKRLLTIEGKSLSSNAKVPRGRLWDVETGREILDLTIAEVNHYDWDLFFDDSGQRLTQLLFNKSTGTTSGGSTAIFDARPLDPAVDHGIAADRLIATLSRRFALKSEWVAEIESRSGLKPGIREAALARVRDAADDPDQVAKLAGTIVGSNDRSLQDYQRALVWAKDLIRMEPHSIRSRALMGAAYYRLDRTDEALRVLLEEKGKEIQPASEMNKSYDKLRYSVLGLVYHRLGMLQEAGGAVEKASKITQQTQDLFAVSMMMEAASRVPVPKRIVPTAPESMPNEETLKKRVESFRLVHGDPDLALTKLPARSGHRLAAYDIDQDQSLNLAESMEAFRDMYRFGIPIAKADWNSGSESYLEFLDAAIRDAPRYLTARFARAWIRATSSNPQFRDSAKALEESIDLCEQTKYQDAIFLEGLAAAHASSSDFDSAVRWQKEALRLHLDQGAAFSHHCADEAQVRLSAYEAHRVCEPKLPHTNDLVVKQSSIEQREWDVSVAYLSPESVLHAKRIVGSGACWSPDGTRIVRSLKSGESGGALEWIDLTSGKTQQVCEDGATPVWTATPAERIYFARRPAVIEKLIFNATIWYCDPDGGNLTKWMDGSLLSPLKDGGLLVHTMSVNGSDLRTLFKGFQVSGDGSLKESEIAHELKGAIGEISPDGRLLAELSGNLVIREIASNTVLYSNDLTSRGIGSVDGAWSFDCRYYVYSSVGKSATPGMWILDITTGETRLLTDLDVTAPSWSHDGSYIAANERGKHRIVILDVRSLQREKGLLNALQQSP